MSDSIVLWILEATVILAVGIAAAAFWRSRAAVGHIALVLALFAVVVLPGASWVARQAGVGFLPPLVAGPGPGLTSVPPAQIVPKSPRTAPTIVQNAPLLQTSPTVPPTTPAPPIKAGEWMSRDVAVRGLWIAGAILSGLATARFLVSAVAAVVMRARSRPWSQPTIEAAIRRSALDLGIHRNIELRASQVASCPMIWCWGRPAVIVSEGAARASVDWNAVVAHELAHLKRRDHLWAMLAELVVCVIPWHPLAWIARRRLGALAEIACDDWAMRSAGSPMSYADSLLAFVPRPRSLLTPAILTRTGLGSRVAHILSESGAEPRVRRRFIALAASAVVAGITLGALARPRQAPQEAKPAAPAAAQPANGEAKTQLDALVESWQSAPDKKASPKLWDPARKLSESDDPRIIPVMIGIIDADQSYNTVYGLGYFGLGKVTGVKYSSFHDGAWWRRWWETNKGKFPESVRQIPIPELPKTAYAAAYKPFPADLDTSDGLIRKLLEDYSKPQSSELELSSISDALVKINDPRAIPVIIGVIDADNSSKTVYGLGYFALTYMTKVQYSPYHDGAWWRRWWEANKATYPEAARNTPVPELPKTAYGRSYTPMPASFETLDGKVAWLRGSLAAGQPLQWSDMAEALASHKDARAIPIMIGLIEAENTEETIYGVGYFGLRSFVTDKYDKSHDGAWWRRWWEDNKTKFSPEAQETPIPDFKELIANWSKGAKERERAEVDAQFSGFPAEKIAIGGDDRKQYFLIGPEKDQQPPADGWKLLLILPGGDGGAAFHPFCRSIHKEALPPGYIAAELVAHAWSKDPNRTVWPTSSLNREGAEFTTEEFIRAVVTDVSQRVKIDSKRVFALAWSSSGPALYCDSLEASTPVTGYFIAMSVFRPQWMGDVAGAKGRAYYILHSPDDKMIPITAHAREAEKKLQEAGASVVVTEYSGGHGWTEDPFGHIRKGVEWLESKTAK